MNIKCQLTKDNEMNYLSIFPRNVFSTILLYCQYKTGKPFNSLGYNIMAMNFILRKTKIIHHLLKMLISDIEKYMRYT